MSGTRVDVAERLRHLLVLDEQMLDVHPEARERLLGRALALRDLVLVMRKDQIDAAGVDVDRRLAQQPQRHRRALDVPAWTARARCRQSHDGSPGLVAFHSTKSRGVVLRVFVHVHAARRPACPRDRGAPAGRRWAATRS